MGHGVTVTRKTLTLEKMGSIPSVPTKKYQMNGKLIAGVVFGFFVGALFKSEHDDFKKETEHAVWDLTTESREIVEGWREKYRLSFTEIPPHRVQKISGGGYVVNVGDLIRDLRDE